MIQFYQYPKCSTCIQARKYLEKNKIQFDSIDITLNPPSKKQLEQMLEYCGGDVKKLFNTSGVQYRELKISDKIKSMSKKEAIDLLSQNGKLIKRPFLLGKNFGVVGFKAEQWDSQF